MKNRPLCSLCLVIAILIGILTAGAGAKFVSELRPSPVEQYGEKDDWLIVRGQVYKKEEKEKYQILYLKKCSVYFQKDQQSQQNQQSQQSLIKESRMLIYDEKKNKIQIGNEVEAEGKLSFFETARNPGNFDQKAYYQRQNIHGKVWSETLRITDHTVKRIQNVLENNGSPRATVVTDEDRTFFRITIPCHEAAGNIIADIAHKDASVKASRRGARKSGLQSTPESGLQSTPESTLKIIEQIQNNPQITMTEIANVTGYSRSWVAKTIKRLQEQNIIKHIGSNKNGYWEIITK